MRQVDRWYFYACVAFAACGCSDAQSGHAVAPVATAQVVRPAPNVQPLQAASDAGSAKPTTPNAVHNPGSLIHIAGFDCEQSEDAAVSERDDVPAVRPAHALSRWSLGGPAGSAWNAEQLRCVVQVDTTCQRGRVLVQLRVGSTLLASKTLDLQANHAPVAEFLIGQRAWRKQLDVAERTTKPLLFRTGVFRAGVLLSCELPEVAAGVGPYREFADNASFVAGFAFGE